MAPVTVRTLNGARPGGRSSPGRAPASALRPAGSTRDWRKLRATWARALPMECWRCGEMIEADPPGTPDARSGWVLGHVIARADGGGDDQLAPEHRGCSESSGGELGAARRWQAAGLGPSRDWGL